MRSDHGTDVVDALCPWGADSFGERPPARLVCVQTLQVDEVDVPQLVRERQTEGVIHPRWRVQRNRSEVVGYTVPQEPEDAEAMPSNQRKR